MPSWKLHVAPTRVYTNTLLLLGAPTAQRFYPQCAPCSQKQSAAVRALSRRSVLHLPTVRPFHLTGFVSAPLSRASAPKKRWYE